jgi:exodeoxyribonuclease VII small subunit
VDKCVSWIARCAIQAQNTPDYGIRQAMAQKNNDDIKQLPFERAIEELESIVKRLEEGKVPLEESVTIYERGEALKRRCEELLRQAEARVEKITLDASGKPTGTTPLDVE